MNTKQIIADSGIAFGTSGARGLVEDFTANACAAFTISFNKIAKEKFSFDSIAIAIDNRPSSYRMAQSCAAALLQINVKPIFYGVIPTPALANQAMADKQPAIMVTGSHIPFDRNGIKFYLPDGEITKDDEVAILNNSSSFENIQELPELSESKIAAINYVERYTSLYPNNILENFTIGIYEHSSAGRDLYSQIFQRLGANVISLGRSDKFIPIDTEAVAESDKTQAIEWSSKYNLDAIFSTDGDGDRPLLADENGVWLRGDILGILAAKKLKVEAISTPINCNTSIHSLDSFKMLSLTKIGSPYVIESIVKLKKQHSYVAGFEANGGFILGSDIKVNGRTLTALPTRDAVLPVITLLTSAYKKSLSKLVSTLPPRYTYSDRAQNFPSSKSDKLIAEGINDPQNIVTLCGIIYSCVSKIDTTDGLRITLENDDILHLRKSGNAPELRCYAESDSMSSAQKIVMNALSRLTENYCN